VPANPKKRGLQDEADGDRNEIKAPWPEHALSQREERVRHGHKKAERRKKKELAIHREHPA
jgi:hypothetical protein